VARSAGWRCSPAGRAWTGTRGWLGGWLARPLVSLHLLLATFGLLTLLGLVMVLSASSIEAYQDTGNSFAVFDKQLVSCAMGLVLFVVGLRTRPDRLRSLSPYLLVAVGVLLATVLVPGLGSAALGAQKWFLIGGVSMQPSELAKVALVLWGAHVLALRHRLVHRWRDVLVPLVPVALVVATLVVVEPDLGTTVCFGIVLFALLYFAGAPTRLLAALGAAAAAATVALAFGASYRLSRVTSFLTPDAADPQGPGYQARQALYSLADGGLLGAGLGQGAAKWSYLPNAATDFIFAIVGEELGLVGALAVVALFVVLGFTGLRIAARNVDPFNRTAAATLTALLVGQAFINIGYVIGLLPVTGITLPLISAGGNSIEVSMFAFGLLANFARHEPAALAALRDKPGLARILGPSTAPPPLAPAGRRTPPRTATAG